MNELIELGLVVCETKNSGRPGAPEDAFISTEA